MFHERQVTYRKTGAYGLFAMITAALVLSGTPAHAKKGKGATKIQKPWVKICRGAKDKKACTIRIDEVDRISLKPYSPILMEYFKGKPTMLKVTLPHVWPIGVTLTNNKTKKEIKSIQPLDVVWDIQKNAFIQVGDKGKKIPVKFDQCNGFGCIAAIKMTDGLLSSMKKGKKIIVAGYSKRLGKEHGMSFPLGDFAASYDGSELDEKIYAKALNKKVITLRKKRYEFMKKRQAAIKKAQEAAKKKK